MIKFKSRLFYKYIVSYMFIFLIPLTGMGYFIYNNAVTNLRTEIEAVNLDKLEQVGSFLDLQVAGLEKTAAKISVDKRLTPFMFKANDSNTIDAIEELGRYKANSANLEEVLFYLRGETSIYSSAGINSLDAFTKHFYKFASWNEEDFYNDINGIEQMTIRPSELVTVSNHNETRMVTFLFPIPYKSLQSYGTAVFMLQAAVFARKPLSIWRDRHSSNASDGSCLSR